MATRGHTHDSIAAIAAEPENGEVGNPRSENGEVGNPRSGASWGNRATGWLRVRLLSVGWPTLLVVGNATDRLVWVDCEMTGLDLSADALIEVAVLVTDSELNVLGDGVQVVIRPPAQALVQMPDIVRKMHIKSGLLDELDDGVTMTEAEDLVMTYVLEHVPEPGKTPLAGNTVHMDRLFLARDMHRLHAHLHYRHVDVSSIKELVRRWYPRVYFAAPAKTGNHRALGDIQDSIAELAYYRQTVFVPMPGPDTPTSRAAAEGIEQAMATE